MLTGNKWLCLALLIAVSLLLAVEAKQKDGKIASALENYHSTLKCVANIAEETLPELDTFVACCGFWTLHDFLIQKVEDECDETNLEQVHHLSGMVSPVIREQCSDYKQGSFACRMLVIMPIVIICLVVLLILAVCVCAHVTLYKWVRVRRKYRRVVNMYQAQQVNPEKLSLPGKLLPTQP